MKKQFLKITFAVALLGLTVSSCKKSESDATPDDFTEQSTGSSDNSEFNTSINSIIDDANTAISGTYMAGGRTEATTICGATVVTDSASRIVTITYDGTSACNNAKRTRSGTVVVSLPANTKWKDAGAELTVTLTNFKSTRISDGKSITLNGTKTITNVNGGLVKLLSSGSNTVVHKIKGTFTIKFDDGSTRAWQIARKRTISVANNVTSISIEGDTTVLGYSNLESWGVNRYGKTFYTSINTPIVLSSTCDYDAVSGVVVHKGLTREITATYGVDAAGNSVTGTNCPYGFKIEWVNLRNQSKTSIIQYK